MGRTATLALDSDEIRQALDRHVLDAWFPICLDHENGGFLCDFDARWRPDGAQVKMLEFQARHARVAALGCRLHPGDPAWRKACEQGWHGLRDGLWDAEHGGWYWCADRSWTPIDDGAKHSHGMAYAILACLDVARTLDDDGALERAREGFAWLDAHAWDDTHGGYWGWMRRDGRAHANDPAAAGPRDHMGIAPNRKSVNVAGDMVETLTEVQYRDPSPLAAERLRALVGHFDMWFEQDGRIALTQHADLTPASSALHGGYSIQASWRLPLARAALGEPLVVGPVERGLRKAGLSVTGPRGFVADASGREEWWMQFELLRSLVLHAAVHPEEAASLEGSAATGLDRLARAFIDTANGGVHQMPRRFLRTSHKGNRWKDASHEAMAWHVAAGILARPAGSPPITLDEVLAL